MSVGESACARAHGLAALSTPGGPGPRGPGSGLAARDYRDVTLSLWPPRTGTPREPHSPAPRRASPRHRAPLGTCAFFPPLPIHGPFCLLDPTGWRGAFRSAGLGSWAALGSASSRSKRAKEPALGTRSGVRKPDAARLGAPNRGAERGTPKGRGRQDRDSHYVLPALRTPIRRRFPGKKCLHGEWGAAWVEGVTAWCAPTPELFPGEDRGSKARVVYHSFL